MSTELGEGPRIAACFHGFLRTGVSMLPVRWRLRREGYREVLCPTARYELADLPTLGAQAAARIGALSDRHGGARVDVITHSMGGLVLRAALAHSPPLRRVVMLAPPNQGAQAAEKVRQILPIHRLGWDPLAPLLPGRPLHLPVPVDAGVELGILVGGTGDERGFSRLLEGDNDGKVRVAEARLAGAADFAVIPAGHSFVMARPWVLDQVLSFLDTGRFQPDLGGGS